MGIFRRKRKIEVIHNGRSQMPLKRRTYVIHHYCPHTFNAGDHFVIRSIRRFLAYFLPEAMFVPKACADNRGWGRPIGLRGENINLSNRYADAVIIGGSDQYNNWSLRIRKQEVERLIPPLFLIGLGVSSKSVDSAPRIDDKSYYRDILATNQVARMSSVRDHYTQRFLEGLGYDKAVVTGCPAMYLYDDVFEFSRDGFVAVTFPFPVVRTDNKRAYSTLVESIRDILRLLESLGLRYAITCHDDRDVFVAQQIFPEEEIFFSNYVDRFLDFYRRCSIVIGSRLHASILAAGMGKPFVNINLDARGKGFSETFELSDWNLDIDNPNLLSDLHDRLKTILSGNLSVFEKLTDVRGKYRTCYMDFMSAVAASIRQSVGGEEPPPRSS